VNKQEREQQRSELEYELQYRLNNIIEKIKAKGITQISVAQLGYNGQVEGFIRKTAIRAYDLGADYADAKLGTYNVTEDELLQEHKQVTQLVADYAPKFWRKVYNLIHRNDTLLQKYDFAPRSPLNSNYMATSTAIGLVTKAIALGTIDKIKLVQRLRPIKGARFTEKKQKAREKKFQLREERKKQQEEFIALKSKADSTIEDALGDTTGVGLEEGQRDESKDQVVWNAINDRNTCEVCADLDGQYFDVDDPDMPVPGEACLGGDNCRCNYDVELATSLIVEDGLSSIDEQYL